VLEDLIFDILSLFGGLSLPFGAPSLVKLFEDLAILSEHWVVFAHVTYKNFTMRRLFVGWCQLIENVLTFGQRRVGPRVPATMDLRGCVG
jgi:hypothetical protein